MDHSEDSREHSLVRKLHNFSSTYIDYKIGALGAGFMGMLVFGINYQATSDLFLSSVAASKQATYTFFFGGAIMKSCEYLASHIKRSSSALAAAVIIPSAATLSLTYGLHNLKGTPKPLESTIPTSLVLPATIYWARRKRAEAISIQSL